MLASLELAHIGGILCHDTLPHSLIIGARRCDRDAARAIDRVFFVTRR